MKKILTDRGLKTLASAPPGKRYMLWDAVVPSFGVRVTDRARITFVVMRRLDVKILRRTLGAFPAMSLEKARRQARAFLEDIAGGVDPLVRKEEESRARVRARESSFSSIAEEFIRRHVARLRTAKATEQVIRKHLIGRFGHRSIAEITRRDVLGFLDDLEDHPPTARRTFVHLAQIFDWAIGREIVSASPCERIKIGSITGPRVIRRRILTDDEIQIFWRATATLGYPLMPFLRLLLLTAQRRSEVAEMSWPEIDIRKKLWTIPPERMKTGAIHVVPLAPGAIKIIEALPRFNAGRFMLSTTAGEKAISGFANVKTRVDRAAQFSDFRLHDLRRTARTHFSTIAVDDIVREMAISHTKPGLHQVYDQHSYLDERRCLFEQWEQRLEKILDAQSCPEPNWG